MPRWIITDDQGFDATADDAMEELESIAIDAGQPKRLWKLHSEASVSVAVTVTTEDD